MFQFLKTCVICATLLLALPRGVIISVTLIQLLFLYVRTIASLLPAFLRLVSHGPNILGSASLPFQGSSQSEEIYTCPNITFNMCEVK